MDAVLQRHCARYIYVVPDGLRELMSDISREVLRSHPANIYHFIADYLDALLLTRENARIAAKLVQNVSDAGTATVGLLERTGMERYEADVVVGVIQATFLALIEDQPPEFYEIRPSEEVQEKNVIVDIIYKSQISPERVEEAAKIIQQAYRNFKHRKDKERQLLSGLIDWRVAARSAIRLYRKTGVTNEEANRAATLIKAAYKGYYSRRVIRKLAEETVEIYQEEREISKINEKLELAETQSQKNVRINYETVIPHVDFDDPKMTAIKSNESSTEMTAGVLNAVFSDSSLKSSDDLTTPSSDLEIEGVKPGPTPLKQALTDEIENRLRQQLDFKLNELDQRAILPKGQHVVKKIIDRQITVEEPLFQEKFVAPLVNEDDEEKQQLVTEPE